MEDDSWQEYAQWHELFDELCNRAGYYDTAALASAYCALTASKGERQFDTAIRNLNNWRSGRHLPRAGNLRIVAKLLKVTDSADLQAHWKALYKKAKDLEAERQSAALNVPAPRTVAGRHLAPATVMQPLPYPSSSRTLELNRGRFSTVQLMASSMAMLVLGGVLGSLITISDWRLWPGPADNAPIVPFKPLVTMRVGEARPIYAERGDCGKLPRDWPLVEADLPALRTGTFSDGGLARRHSKFCQGLTPARAIIFTAMEPGVEEFEIQGDFFKMTVTE